MPEGIKVAIILLVIICLPIILCIPIFTTSYFSNQTKIINVRESGAVRQKISNSINEYILKRVLFIIMLLIMVASTYSEAKLISFIGLIGLVLILKDNYKIYLDFTVKDGLNISGTIVNAFTQSSFNAWGRKYEMDDFEYILEIETDDGGYVKCASRMVALLPGERIEDAYVTKRTNLLLYCYKPQISSNE
jgi:hypothetical protein